MRHATRHRDKGCRVLHSLGSATCDTVAGPTNEALPQMNSVGIHQSPFMGRPVRPTSSTLDILSRPQKVREAARLLLFSIGYATNGSKRRGTKNSIRLVRRWHGVSYLARVKMRYSEKGVQVEGTKTPRVLSSRLL